VIKNFHVM